MTTKYTTEQFQKDAARWFEEGLGKLPRPDKAIAEQAAILKNFQEQVSKQVGETRSLLDSAKAFLKDPKAEGTRIVKDGLKAADNFFANLFKLLSKDVGAAFKTIISGTFEKIKSTLNTAFGKQFTAITKWFNGQLRGLNNKLLGLGRTLERSTNKALQPIGKALSQLSNSFNRTLNNWGKTSGITKAIASLGTMGRTISQNSKALQSLSGLSKSFSTLLAFAKLGLKMLPILGAVFDLKWKNETRQYLIEIKRQQDLNAKIADKQFTILGNKIKALESKNTVDYAKIGSEVRANIPQNLAKTNDLAGISQGVGSIARSIASLKIPAATVVDYSRIQNGVTSAVNAAKTPTQTQNPIDYTKIAASVTQALAAANLSPGTISDSVVAKTKSVTPAELAQILERNNTAQSLAQAAAIKQGLAGVKVEIPPDLARKADVDAIPSKIPKQTIDFSPVLSRLTTIDNTLVNLGQKFKPVDINPLQDKLNQLQNGISQLPGQVTNNLSNFSNSIVSNLSNFITNNNTTIVNKMAPALNPDAIINPIKTHINTQVAQPLATTMEVLNVNDLKKGVTMSAEAVIKASGFQQYGQSGTGTATNLIGLTAMIAAPIFFRAGFHQLGTTFPADMRKPDGAKVTPTTALSTSQWQFNQITNLVGMSTPHVVKDASGGTSIKTFQNQAHIVEEIHAQNLGLEQDVSAIEKYCFYLLQNQEMMIQLIMQNKYDIDVLVDESGAKTKQKIIQRPGLVTHTKDSSFFDKLMTSARNHMVVREWNDEIDSKQLARKTNMEAQVAAMSNKFEFDKTDPKLPIVDRTKQNPKAQQDDEWQRYVNTSKNPGTVRQSTGLPIPEIKEIKLGNDKEVPKPTKDPDKLLGS
jgi:hypothetical protein